MSSKGKRSTNGGGDVNSEKKVKTTLNFQLNEKLLQSKSQLANDFKVGKSTTIDSTVELIAEPFKCVLMKDFINNNDFLRELKEELQEIDYIPKDNDSYRFRQSADLKAMTNMSNITELRRLFLNDVRSFLSEITDIELFDDIVDLTASKYEYNDDQQPGEIFRRISPKWNQFVFFEVSPNSYHQVSEVLSQDKTRPTVNGWFRGPAPQCDSSIIFAENYASSLIKCGDVEIDEVEFRSWINATYLDDYRQLEIQDNFSDTSEISLANFLNDGKYTQMCQLLVDDASLEWQTFGPPNRRHYYRLNMNSAPKLAQDLVKLFQSEAMFLTISNLSGIKFHPLSNAPDSDEDSSSEECSDEQSSENEEELAREQSKARKSVDRSKNERKRERSKKAEPTPQEKTAEAKVRNPRVSVEIRKWTKGCYTLCHDHDPEIIDNVAKLDCILHFAHDYETNSDHGRFVSYIAKDADEELLSIEPHSNQLALVYRDAETARFVKYLNNSHADNFYDISCMFFE